MITPRHFRSLASELLVLACPLNAAKASFSIAVCLLLGAYPLRADVLYSNLGPGDSFYPNVGAPIDFQLAYANEFTAAFTEPITSIDVAIFGPRDAQSVTLTLYANNPLTNLPAAASMLTLGNVVSAAANISQLERLTLSTPVPLVAGVSYWLEMSAAVHDSAVGWNRANNYDANPSAFSDDGGMTFTARSDSFATAFRINSDPVPEPSAWALLLSGFACALAAIGRRRSCTQLHT